MLVQSLVFTTLFVSFASAGIFKSAQCPGSSHRASNPKCCVYYDLADALQKQLFGNICGEDVHESLRLTFHDAIGFSKSGKFRGKGADGSMIIFKDIETNYAANLGIADAVDALIPFLHQFPSVSAGDLIQLAGAVGTANCPGAPRLQFLAGRPNATVAASDGTLPIPEDSVTKIINRMADAGFTSDELVWLLASHSIGRADHVDSSLMGAPFDTTPFTFDTQFYLEVLLKGTGWPGKGSNAGEVLSPLPTSGEIRIASDWNIAHDPRTSCAWQSMVNNQRSMMNLFGQAMAKLAVVGQNTRQLLDCSEVVQQPPSFSKSIAYPAGTGPKSVQQSCRSPFPNLKTTPGQPTKIPACPNGALSIDSCDHTLGSTYADGHP